MRKRQRRTRVGQAAGKTWAGLASRLDALDALLGTSPVQGDGYGLVTVIGEDGSAWREIVGSDKSKTYGPYSKADTDAFLNRIKAAGFVLTGQNPWHIDVKQHGIELDAAQDASGVVTVTVASKNFYVPYGKIWDKVDAVMPAASANVSAASSSAASSSTTAPASGVAQQAATQPGSWQASAPTDASSDEDKVSFLENAYQHLKSGVAHLKELDDKAKKKAAKVASDAVASAKALASDVKTRVKDRATKAAEDLAGRVSTVQKGLNDVEDAVTTYAGAIGIGALVWPLVAGFVIYELVFKEHRAS